MGQGSDRRKLLFDRFSGQLSLLQQHGIINRQFQNARPYLCPICLNEFNKNDLIPGNKNFLTLEDAPPDSLKGSKVALTCKKCNNECGTKIDQHLTEAIRAVDASYFYKGSKQYGTIDHEGEKVTVELTSMGDGTLQAYHRISKNNPTVLDKFIYGLKNKTIGPLLNLDPPKIKFDSNRVNYALVKANYIITFAKFGYIFLLDDRFDNIRQQLLNPEQDIYPWAPFIKNQFQRTNIGTHYVHNKGIQSIFNIFSLRTEYSETLIGGLLPLPRITMDDFTHEIDSRKNEGNMIILDSTKYDPNANLFSDMHEINKINNWVNKM